MCAGMCVCVCAYMYTYISNSFKYRHSIFELVVFDISHFVFNIWYLVFEIWYSIFDWVIFVTHVLVFDICVTWRTRMCDMAHSYVWHGSFRCGTCLTWHMSVSCHTHESVRHVTQGHVSRDTWVCHVTHMNQCVMSRIHVLCVTWRTHMCDMYVWHDALIHMCDITHLHVWHESFICVTWLIRMYDMAHS